ncbi:MAG: hypothetical protein N3G22_00990 [Candidatus Micrarchaeota archaeon]|nr:hypothetical protein [Candidatus Micrarchaeota archaeon]
MKKNSLFVAFLLVGILPLLANSATASVQLYPGWNLVSSPFYYYDSLDSAGCDFTGDFYQYIPSIKAYSKSKTLSSVNGAWVYSRNACILKFTSSRPDDVLNEDILYAGWNQVGQPFLSEGESVDFADVIGTCQGKVASGPWYYDTPSKTYVYSPKLSRGKGVWIKVSSDCNLQRPSKSQPPQPPSSDNQDQPIFKGVLDLGASYSGEIKVKLVDIKEGPIGAYVRSQLEAYDTSNRLVKSFILDPKNYEKVVLPSGATYLVYVEEAQRGYSLSAGWAKIRIYRVAGSPDALSAIQAGDEANPSADGGASPDLFLKEGTISLGQTIDAGQIRVFLLDLGSSGKEKSPAMVSVQDMGGAEIKRLIIPVGSFRMVELKGTNYAIYAEETAPDITLNTKWAALSIYEVRGRPDSAGRTKELVPLPSGKPTLASASLKIGQPLHFSIANVPYSVFLDGISAFPDNNREAIVSVKDSSGNPIAMRSIPANKGAKFSAGRAKFLVYVNSISLQTSNPGESKAVILVYDLS